MRKRQLIVTEKPSVGGDIANILDCREKKKGYIEGKQYIITWAVGHLVELPLPEEINPTFLEWKIEDLPIIPARFSLKVIDSSKSQFAVVSELMNDPSVDEVICATDAGREGELIFRYIYQKAGCSKPVKRLWISSLTYAAIREGFENLRPDSEYDNLFQSAKCRSEADWMIGMNASRAYAIENGMRGISIGRVVSPTLSILVQREKERRNFVPEEYCELTASFDGYKGKLIRSECNEPKERTHFTKDQKIWLKEFADNHSGSATVTWADNKENMTEPQQLYDLTSLQRDANRLFGMTSKRTLETAQSLYERRKAITYPRTDSRYLSSDMKSTLSKRLECLSTGELAQYAEKAKKSDKNLFGRFINNAGVTDHHAIIPTGEAKDQGQWTSQEKLIYDLISRRFIGMFFPARKTIIQEMGTSLDGKEFISAGEKIVEEGWSAVDKSRQSDTVTLPERQPGDLVKVHSVEICNGKTEAPAPHTEASLLLAMEHAGKIVSEDEADEQETEFGIGTPATRADTIEKIVKKEMAVRKGRRLIPTEYGIKLVEILPKYLRSPKMTGEWEAKLKQISNGRYSAEKFMEGIRDLTKDTVEYAIKLGDTGIKDINNVGTCPLCGKAVKEYTNAYYCVNKECGFRKIYKSVKGYHPTLNSFDIRNLLANEEAETEKGTFRLITESPYITFEYAPAPVPDYKALYQLIEDTGVEMADNVAKGGSLWIAGEKDSELMEDFVCRSKELGCPFEYTKAAGALNNRNGWYHKVRGDYLKDYRKAFHFTEQEPPNREDQGTSINEQPTKDIVLNLIKESGFEFVDKRKSGGRLWVIAGEEEAKPLINKCKEQGVSFAFSQRGGQASNHQPAWYSLPR